MWIGLHYDGNNSCLFVRDRTLSTYQGGRSAFVRVMKYFRQILMGREIFFKIFDASQRIFLCSVFVILFFKLKGLEHKYPNLPSRRFTKDKAC